jgi:hypothetical protein
MSQRTGSRISVVSAILALVIGGGGLIASLILNAFVFDKFDAYGEVPIPGSTSLHLPAGEVNASFHTVITGQPSGGLPVPNLHLSIVSPKDLPEVSVNENFGTSTTVNNDARVRVWVLQVPQAGTYEISTDGDVGGYISPRLAFGHGSAYGWLTWVFGALLAVGAVALTASLVWSARSAKKARPLAPQEVLGADAPAWSGAPTAVPTPVDGYTPSDQGVRLEQLKQLAALRDSGALTDDEFDAEKRRILEN